MTAPAPGNLVDGSWTGGGGKDLIDVRDPANTRVVVARVTELAKAGQVAVNLPISGWDVQHPFGGFADSGSPFKEQGLEGLRFYTRIKTVAIGHSGR
jgi:hypothetical protein